LTVLKTFPSELGSNVYLVEKAMQEGIDREEYDKMMDKGLTSEQKKVAEDRVSEASYVLTLVFSLVLL